LIWRNISLEREIEFLVFPPCCDGKLSLFFYKTFVKSTILLWSLWGPLTKKKIILRFSTLWKTISRKKSFLSMQHSVIVWRIYSRNYFSNQISNFPSKWRYSKFTNKTNLLKWKIHTFRAKLRSSDLNTSFSIGLDLQIYHSHVLAASCRLLAIDDTKWLTLPPSRTLTTVDISKISTQRSLLKYNQHFNLAK